MALKFNPFQPNKIVAPGMFTGRVAEIQSIEQCLFQAKNSNPQHFLIQGERGIGKSSLLLYVNLIATGQLQPLDAPHMRFISVQIDLGGCQTQIDIIRALGRGLRESVNRHQGAKEKAKIFWDWLTNWEVLGVRYHKDNPHIDPQDLGDELVSRIRGLLEETYGFVDGLLFLIDEADQPPLEADLGQFVKVFTERLTKLGGDRVILGMAGLPQILTKLRDSHESSPRIFQMLLLEPLEVDERKKVVDIGLKQANDKNGFVTTITDAALEFIADFQRDTPTSSSNLLTPHLIETKITL